MQTLALDTVVLDDYARATDDLAGVALTVNLAETSPSTEDLGVTDLDQVDLVLGAESLNELYVLSLRAGLDEDAKVSLTLVEGLGALAQATGKTVVDKGVLQNLLYISNVFNTQLSSQKRSTHLKSILNGQLALGGLGGHLNLGGGGVDLNFISSVRHPGQTTPRSDPRFMTSNEV